MSCCCPQKQQSQNSTPPKAEHPENAVESRTLERYLVDPQVDTNTMLQEYDAAPFIIPPEVQNEMEFDRWGGPMWETPREEQMWEISLPPIHEMDTWEDDYFMLEEVWEDAEYFEPPHSDKWPDPPPVVERRDLDRALSQRMNWKAAPGTVSKARTVNPGYILYTPFPKVEPLPQELSREERIVEGKKLLKSRLRLLSMESVEILEDGNCQFRAFSMELYGSQEYHMSVRASAVCWLSENDGAFSAFVGDAIEWQEYLTKMTEPQTWGDQITLRAVCEVYGIVVHLITTERENWHEVYEPTKTKPPFRHVFLEYVSPIHYNALKSSI